MPEFESPQFSDNDVLVAYGTASIVVPSIGVGAFKIAYREDTNSGGVLKIVYRYANPVDVAELGALDIPDRVFRELESLAVIDCPHVVKVTRPPHVVQLGAYSYLAYSEVLCEGGSLRAMIDAGVIGEARARELIRGALLGVDALWSSGQIVHRDIKPENILLDSQGRAVLVDLGIAMHGELSPLTDTGLSSPKTPRYAAPEQFSPRREVQFDSRTDQFAIGVVAFEALTGEHPFARPGMHLGEYFDAINDFSTNDPRLDGVSDEMKALIKKFLEFQQYRRYRTTELALAALGGQA